MKNFAVSVVIIQRKWCSKGVRSTTSHAAYWVQCDCEETAVGKAMIVYKKKFPEPNTTIDVVAVEIPSDAAPQEKVS